MRPIVKFTGTSCFSFGNNTFPAKVEKSYKISLCKKCQEHELMNSLLKADQGRKKDLSGTTVFLTRVKFLTKRAVLNKMPKKLKKE